MKTIELITTAPDGEQTRSAVRPKRVRTKLRTGWAAFGVKKETRDEQGKPTFEAKADVEVKETVIGSDPLSASPERESEGQSAKSGEGKEQVVLRRTELRRRLKELVVKALTGKKRKGVDFANLKIVYELLLKDEAAELERRKLDAAAEAKTTAMTVVTQEEMTVYVRRLLGKEITL